MCCFLFWEFELVSYLQFLLFMQHSDLYDFNMNYFEYMFRTLIPKATPIKVFIVRIIYLINLVVSQLLTQ